MFTHILADALKTYGLAATEAQLQQFTSYYEQLIETNNVMNLTAITDPYEVAVKHMVDSLSCYDKDYFPKGATLLDVGTGAGFPGVPLAIWRPDLKITFFDSLAKRLYFIEDVCTRLSLKNALFLHGRAEDLAHEERYRGQYDIVTSRALARLPVLLEWTLPYVKNGGVFIALKGAQYEEEQGAAVTALTILGGVIEKVNIVKLPGLEDKRAVLYIRKEKNTPKKYPRKPKMAVKNPL